MIIKNNKYSKKKILLILIILIILILFLIFFLIIFCYYKKNYYYKNDTFINKYKLPKTIWVFWDNPELPNNISLIINNNKQKLGNEWTINVLNDTNINNYLDTSIFPKNYNNLEIQFKSDFLRLKLLHKYGGIWMDASIIINSKDELENIFTKTIDNNIELTAFTLFDKEDSYKYHQYIENWFLIAPKNSNIISLWLEEFENAINMGFNDYKTYIKDKLNVKLFYKIENSNCYLTMHTALQVVLQNKIDYIPKLLLLKSEDNMFKLYSDCGWDNECIKTKFENDIEIKKIPYIKLTGSGSGLNIEKYFL
jgi:hypothetical protein